MGVTEIDTWSGLGVLNDPIESSAVLNTVYYAVVAGGAVISDRLDFVKYDVTLFFCSGSLIFLVKIFFFLAGGFWGMRKKRLETRTDWLSSLLLQSQTSVGNVLSPFPHNISFCNICFSSFCFFSTGQIFAFNASSSSHSLCLNLCL